MTAPAPNDDMFLDHVEFYMRDGSEFGILTAGCSVALQEMLDALAERDQIFGENRRRRFLKLASTIQAAATVHLPTFYRDDVRRGSEAIKALIILGPGHLGNCDAVGEVRHLAGILGLFEELYQAAELGAKDRARWEIADIYVHARKALRRMSAARCRLAAAKRKAISKRSLSKAA